MLLMSERDAKLLLEDIIESIDTIKQFVKGITFDEFYSDRKTVDAVTRNFEIIGEASSKIPREFQKQHSEIAWRKIIGLRNRVIHDYFEVDYEMIWEIIHKDLDGLKTKLEKILQNL